MFVLPLITQRYMATLMTYRTVPAIYKGEIEWNRDRSPYLCTYTGSSALNHTLVVYTGLSITHTIYTHVIIHASRVTLPSLLGT